MTSAEPAADCPIRRHAATHARVVFARLEREHQRGFFTGFAAAFDAVSADAEWLVARPAGGGNTRRSAWRAAFREEMEAARRRRVARNLPALERLLAAHFRSLDLSRVLRVALHRDCAPLSDGGYRRN